MTRLVIYAARSADGTVWRLTYGNGRHKCAFVKLPPSGGMEAVVTETLREMAESLRAEHARTGSREAKEALDAIMRAGRAQRRRRADRLAWVRTTGADRHVRVEAVPVFLREEG